MVKNRDVQSENPIPILDHRLRSPPSSANPAAKRSSAICTAFFLFRIFPTLYAVQGSSARPVAFP